MLPAIEGMETLPKIAYDTPSSRCPFLSFRLASSIEIQFLGGDSNPLAFIHPQHRRHPHPPGPSPCSPSDLSPPSDSLCVLLDFALGKMWFGSNRDACFSRSATVGRSSGFQLKIRLAQSTTACAFSSSPRFCSRQHPLQLRAKPSSNTSRSATRLAGTYNISNPQQAPFAPTARPYITWDMSVIVLHK